MFAWVGRTPRGSRRARAVALLCLPGLLASCSLRSGSPIEAGEVRGEIPDLSEQPVLVLPVQLGGSSLQVDPEIRFFLESRGDGSRWIFLEEMDRALSRSPGLEVDPRQLTVTSFLRGEVRRIGDPLFGELRRLSALLDGEFALIPVELRRRGAEEGPGFTLELLVVLVGTRDGRVAWTAVLEGDAGLEGDHRTVASLAENLARALVP